LAILLASCVAGGRRNHANHFKCFSRRSSKSISKMMLLDQVKINCFVFDYMFCFI